MTTPGKWISFGLSGLLLLAACPAYAQVASPGKGWILASRGSLTSTPGEVISGRNSIKGSGTDSYNEILYTDPTYIQFAANQRYTMTMSYRILSVGSAFRGFEFGFQSTTADRLGHTRPTTSTATGAAGSSGTATFTATLELYPDSAASVKLMGSGAIAIDDIRITDRNGQLVASENAEGPTIVPGPLNLQLTDAVTLIPQPSGFLRSAFARDLNGDGYPESILTLSAQPPATTPVPVIIVEASGQMRLATSEFFPTGIPTVKHSPMTLFADLNGDGLQDIVFSDAGGDPFGAGRISVALNLGGGKYRDVSSLIPADQQNTRSYAVVVGDVLSEGHVSIVLPDENDGANTAVLRWNGNGFDEIRNWIPQSIWKGFPYSLHQHSWMNLADLDNDGKQDLLVSGWQGAPNIQLVFGAPGGFANASVMTLPDGPWGHFTPGARPPAAQGAEVQPIVVADFNNDGLPDIFAAERKVVEYQPGAFTDTTDPDYANLRANGGTVYSDESFQVLINQGSRKFVDVTAPNYVNLGDRTYFSLLPTDINNDGFLDIVGLYEANVALRPNVFKGQWGTTFFLNDGTGIFQIVDGSQIIGVTTTPSNGQRWNLGSFVPTVVTPQRTEGIVSETVGGCGGPGFCGVVSLNIYKVVANGSIGTGPNFVDPSTLGVPGFNESYYLNHYPDAAAAVQTGQFKTGLGHYNAVGAAKGYKPHAPNNAIPQGVSVWSDARNYRITYQPDGNVVIYDARQTPRWWTGTNGTTPGTFVMQSDGDMVLRDSQGVVQWESKTTGNPGAYFILQGDGNLVIFSAAGEPIWGAR